MTRHAWKELGGVALVISALSVAVFWPAFDPAQGDIAGRWDVHRQFGPWNYFYDRALQAGDFPEWDPLVFSGTPHAANPQSWALYPPNLLRALLHTQPTPLGTLRGLALLMGLHLVIWALGIYQLARAHGLGRDSALLAAVMASFSALMVRRIAEYHFIFTLALLPWMLLALKGLVASQRAAEARAGLRRGLGYALVLAALFAHSVLGGFLQIVPHLVIALAAYLLAEFFVTAAPRAERTSTASRVLALAGLAGVLAVGLAAVLLVPASELLSYSPRAAGSGVDVGGHKPEAWNVAYAARSLLVYPGRIFEPETLRGAGIIALALACASLAQRSWRQAAPFLAMLYALVDLMLGRPWPLSSLLSLVSPVQLVSGTRAFDVAMLPLSMLAGIGLENLRRTRYAAAVVALMVSIAGVVLLHGQLARGDVWVKPDASVWLVPSLFALALALWLVWPSRAAVWSVLTVLLLIGELLAWNRVYAPALLVKRGFDQDWKVRDGFSGKEPLWANNRRETTDRENFSMFSLRGISNGYDPLYLLSYREAVMGRRKLRYKRTLKELDVVTASPRGHLFLKRPFWLVPSVVRGRLPEKQRLFAPTEVAFVSSPVPAGFPVRDRASVLDRADSSNTHGIPITFWLGGRNTYHTQTGTLPSAHHTLVATFIPYIDGEFDVSLTFRERDVVRPIPGYRRSATARANEPVSLIFSMPDLVSPRVDVEVSSTQRGYVPVLVRLELHEDLGDEDRLIHVERRTADEVRLRVDSLPAPRLLAFIDVAYPGWQAFVDDKPVALANVNDAFKGVWLTPGAHRVRFAFSSPSLRNGLWISLLSLLGGLGLWVWARVRARQR